MLSSMRLCSQIVRYFQHSGVLHRPYLRAQPQFFIHLCARRLDEGKGGGFKMALPRHGTHMCTGNPKEGEQSTCKPPKTTKTVDRHVKCKDIDTSVRATGRESVENKSIDTRPLKEWKSVTPTPPQKSDNRTFAEYKSPSSEGQTTVHKIIPSEQEHNRLHTTTNSPQQECSHDMNGKQKRYTRNLIGGVLLLLATVMAVYYAGFTVKKDSKGEPGAMQKTVRKSKRPREIIKFPAESKDIPDNVPYLLIGGGTASFAAFRAIKSVDPTAKVLVIDNEGYYPYMRPPLSKEIWFNDDIETTKNLKFKQWNGSERSLFYEPEDFYVDCTKLIAHPNGGVAIARGWTVKRIDAFERKAILEDDYEISYEKCLIATGSNPMNLPLFEESSEDIKDKVTLFRGISDFEELEDVIKSGSKSIAIIGGGFLGSELACALARSHKTDLNVYQIFREPGNMGKVLPEYLSLWTTNMVQEEGVNVIANAEVEKVEKLKDQLVLSLNNGRKIMADHVIVAVGASPDTGLAGPSGLEVDEEIGGFLVNAELMARSNLWSAGDCTCFYDVKLGRRRVEHHDHAVVSGRLAGENMTGAGKPYWHQSMFWSDLGPNVGYEAIGIIDSTLPTVGVFAKATDKDTSKAVVEAADEGNRTKTEEEAQPISPASHSSESSKHGEDYGKGVIFYLRNDIIVGIVMWNVFNRMPVARQVLKEEKKYGDLNEVAKLFNIHEE